MGNLGVRIGIEGLGEASLSARSFSAPALTRYRGAAHGWLWLRSFDSSALVFSTGQNLSGRRAAASWKGGAPVRMKGVMREAVLSDVRQVGHIVHHCAGEWGANCGSKVLGRCERGKGASASEAVAEGSMVGRAKAGGVCAARMLRKSDTLKALRAQDYRRDKCSGL